MFSVFDAVSAIRNETKFRLAPFPLQISPGTFPSSPAKLPYTMTVDLFLPAVEWLAPTKVSPYQYMKE